MIQSFKRYPCLAFIIWLKDLMSDKLVVASLEVVSAFSIAFFYSEVSFFSVVINNIAIPESLKNDIICLGYSV